MPTSTYDLIASNVLGSSAASVTFSSIPATYRDLVLVIEAKNSTSSPFFALFPNGDETATSALVAMSGNGSTTGSSSSGSTDLYLNGRIGASTTENILIISNLLDYSTTNKHKTILTRASIAANGVEANAARWPNTAAINSLKIGFQFAAGSSFYLYGIVS